MMILRNLDENLAMLLWQFYAMMMSLCSVIPPLYRDHAWDYLSHVSLWISVRNTSGQWMAFYLLHLRSVSYGCGSIV